MGVLIVSMNEIDTSVFLNRYALCIFETITSVLLSKNCKVGLQSDGNQVKNSYTRKCCNHSMLDGAQVNTKYNWQFRIKILPQKTEYRQG